MHDMAGGDILLADGDLVFRERLARELHDRGYRVFATSVAPSALWLAEALAVEAAAIDVRTPGGAGLDLVAMVRRLRPEVRIIALTAYGGTASALEAMRRGANFYLCRPVGADDILAALTDGRAATENGSGTQASSPSLARVEWEHIQRVLADCTGNVSEAARRLRISRRTLQLKLRRDPPVD